MMEQTEETEELPRTMKRVSSEIPALGGTLES